MHRLQSRPLISYIAKKTHADEYDDIDDPDAATDTEPLAVPRGRITVAITKPAPKKATGMVSKTRKAHEENDKASSPVAQTAEVRSSRKNTRDDEDGVSDETDAVMDEDEDGDKERAHAINGPDWITESEELTDEGYFVQQDEESDSIDEVSWALSCVYQLLMLTPL